MAALKSTVVQRMISSNSYVMPYAIYFIYMTCISLQATPVSTTATAHLTHQKVTDYVVKRSEGTGRRPRRSATSSDPSVTALKDPHTLESKKI